MVPRMMKIPAMPSIGKRIALGKKKKQMMRTPVQRHHGQHCVGFVSLSAGIVALGALARRAEAGP